MLADTVICAVDNGVPTSVDFVRCEPNHMVAAYNNKAAYIFDVETAQPVITFEYASDTGECCSYYWRHVDLRKLNQ